MDPFDIFGFDMDVCETVDKEPCGECPRHGDCNDMFKDTYACREIK